MGGSVEQFEVVIESYFIKGQRGKRGKKLINVAEMSALLWTCTLISANAPQCVNITFCQKHLFSTMVLG